MKVYKNESSHLLNASCSPSDLGILSVEIHPFHNLTLPISGTHCSNRVIVWPKHQNSSDEQCFCNLQTSGSHHCGNCGYDIEYQVDHLYQVTILNLHSFAENLIVHIICDMEYCNHETMHCIHSVTFLTTYRVLIYQEGKLRVGIILFFFFFFFPNLSPLSSLS